MIEASVSKYQKKAHMRKECLFDTELGQERACNLQKIAHIWLTIENLGSKGMRLTEKLLWGNKAFLIENGVSKEHVNSINELILGNNAYLPGNGLVKGV